MRRTLTFALLLLAATSVFAADDVIRKGFNVTDGGTLRLDADFGDVTIVSGGSGVAIEIIREADGKDGEERLRDHKIQISQQGNDVVITTNRRDNDRKWFNWFDWNDFEVKWNIRVPKNYNINVRTSGGSIELDDVAAKVDARTSGGSIRVGDTDGPVDVRTSGGSISLARIRGSVTARTSGGGISIEDATGSVDASTSGGSIKARLSGQLNADSKLSTSGGGITVSIASNVAADLDARASGGGVSSDVPITIQGTMDDDELRGKINGGGPKLTLRTSGGGIKVKSL